MAASAVATASPSVDSSFGGQGDTVGHSGCDSSHVYANQALDALECRDLLITNTTGGNNIFTSTANINRRNE